MAVLVRKVGVRMVSMFIYTILSDLISYGFSGEPMYFIYEVLTYGLMMDIVIAIAGKNLFGIRSSSRKSAVDKSKTDASNNSSSSHYLSKIPGVYLAAITFIELS